MKITPFPSKRSSAVIQPALASVLYASAMPCSLVITWPRLVRTATTTTCSTRQAAGTRKTSAFREAVPPIPSAVALPMDPTCFSMEIIQTRNAAQMERSRPNVQINRAIQTKSDFFIFDS